MTTTSDRVMVTLNVPLKLEEAVVDWLLERGEGAGFTSYVAHGHSASTTDMSLSEQVSGRRKRIQFEIEMTTAEVNAFVRQAAADFGAADVHCVVLPMLAAGSLADVGEKLDESFLQH